MRAGGDQGHVGALVGQGGQVVQFEAERIEDELHRLAGALVEEVQAALGHLDALDAQREGLAGGFGVRLAGRQAEQPGQVEGAVLGEQHLAVRAFQLHIGKVQLALPEAVPLQIGVEAAEAHLLHFGLADVQAPEGQLQAERVELDAFQTGRNCRVVGELLVGDAQGDAGDDQETQQAIKKEHQHQGADETFQSFGHGECRFPS
ncbi:hypothetical protein D9M69_320450 [compost metagenome]